jgi:hypothetical protein
MNITHTWIVKKLKQINDGTGVVSRVNFKVVSRDTETSIAYSYSDEVKLNTEDINFGSFTPYDQLTEEQVLQFVKEKLGHEVEMIENSNALTIQNKINPPSSHVLITDLPWNN